MAKTYSLWKVQELARRIVEERERAIKMAENFSIPENKVFWQGRVDLADDLLLIMEQSFGPDAMEKVKREGE